MIKNLLNKVKRPRVDKELEEFRNLMTPPSTFEDGFTWPAFLGSLFVAAIMVPGAIYMALVAGSNINEAARWVTMILFIEVARRANKSLKRAEIFTLFYLTAAVMAGAGTHALSPHNEGIFHLLWNQFYAQSNAAQSSGIVEQLPFFVAPDQEVLAERSFFMWEWAPAILLATFTTIIGKLDNMVLGYGLFRIASDIEKLPFPIAPIGAQGVLALSEEQEEEGKGGDQLEDGPGAEKQKQNWRWRVFSIGTVIGLTFGTIYLALPIVTGALVGEPVVILTIPFVDWTQKTSDFLPAVATGLSLDFTFVLMGMVLPFYAIIGSFVGLMITFIANPILYHADILHSWNPSDDTIPTLFKDNVDFYFSFMIGVSLSIAVVGLWQAYRGFRDAWRRKQAIAAGEKSHEPVGVPEGRGDIPGPWIVGVYIITTMAYIGVSAWMLYLADGRIHMGVMAVMFFYGFLYTPLISYVTARLEGIAGQVVAIPMVKEAAFILSGYRGVAVWFLPLPFHNYGMQTVSYRRAELTGTSFWSLWKTQIILTPIVLISGLLFANFIWGLAAIPSAQYPYAQKMWELQAENMTVIYSSTLGSYSMFEQAFRWEYLSVGLALGTIVFSTFTWLGAPTFLVYGVVRGMGQTAPHAVIPELLGALIGRFYFQKRLGLKWRQYIPVVMAGFSCGMGLVGTFSIGFVFLMKSVFKLPF